MTQFRKSGPKLNVSSTRCRKPQSTRSNAFSWSKERRARGRFSRSTYSRRSLIVNRFSLMDLPRTPHVWSGPIIPNFRPRARIRKFVCILLIKQHIYTNPYNIAHCGFLSLFAHVRMSLLSFMFLNVLRNTHIYLFYANFNTIMLPMTPSNRPDIALVAIL